jgi:hypothetical protein
LKKEKKEKRGAESIYGTQGSKQREEVVGKVDEMFGE